MTATQAPSVRPIGFTREDAPSYEILNTCVQCGLCLPTCPTYRETYREQSSPRGRVHLMKRVYEGQIDVLDPTFSAQMYECLDCRACEAVCPSGVDYGKVVEASRFQIERAREARGRRSLRERLLRQSVFGQLFPNLGLFRAVAAAARLYQRSGAQRWLRASGLLKRLGLEYLESQLPSMSRRFFVPHDQVYPAIGQRRGRAGLLAGCIMHTANAEIDRATVRVLQRNGWEVAVPEGQGCCGALHAHAGDLARGRELMRRNIAAFDAAGVDVVVNNAAGCGATMKEYGHLLHDDAIWSGRAAAFSTRVRDITELLASAPLMGDLGPIRVTVTYQEPCHLVHAQRIAAAPRLLLRSIPDLKLVEMAESSLCCGSAGIYSVTQPEMSRHLLDRKLDNALATGASIIVSANPGCMLQLRAGLLHRHSSVQVRHIVELLDDSYQRADQSHTPSPSGSGLG